MGRMDLPVMRDAAPVTSATDDTACCAACAERDAGAPVPQPAATRSTPARFPAARAADESPAIPTSSAPQAAPSGRPPSEPRIQSAARALPMARVPGRDADRRIALAAVVLAAGFVGLGILVASLDALGGGVQLGWLPLHLVLAGGAATAIAGVLPCFVAALGAAPPAPALPRATAVACVAVGALLISTRSFGSPPWLPPAGGAIFIVGIALVATVSGRSMRAGLAGRRPLVALAYAVALADIGVGAGIATLSLAGIEPLAGMWAYLRSAHAWLNVVGFVSLVIAGTLVHLLPTVAGTRIAEGRTTGLAIRALAVGPGVVALGLILAGLGTASAVAHVVGAIGAGLTGLAAIALLLDVAGVLRRRGRWTTDPGWHRMTTWSLAAAVGWFAIGVGLAAGRIVALGAVPSAWDSSLVAGPLVLGWVVQALVGSWSHLIPAIAPGAATNHARRRAVLGTAATARIVGLNAGIAALSLGLALDQSPLAAGGGTLVLAVLGANLALAARAGLVGRGEEPGRARPGALGGTPA